MSYKNKEDETTYQRLYKTKLRSTVEGSAALSARQQQYGSKRRCLANGGWVADNADEINLIKKMYRVNFYANHFLQEQIYTLDHRKEIKDGGSHSYDNLEVMTQSDNSKKSHNAKKSRKLRKEDKEIAHEVRPDQYPLFLNDKIISKETRCLQD